MCFSSQKFAWVFWLKGKVLNGNILNELQNYNPKLIEDKVKQQINKKKDKLKNKLKGLLN